MSDPSSVGVALVIGVLACKGDRPNPVPQTGDATRSTPGDAHRRAPGDATADATSDAPGDVIGGNTIRGRMTLDGQPFAHRALELCIAKQAAITSNPFCAEARPRFETRTDATGNYVFTNLPDGAFGIYLLEAPYHTFTLQFPELRGGATREHDAAIPSPKSSAAETTGTGGNTVRGRLVRAGKPLAHVALELCTAHGWNRDDATPCWRGPHRRIARADADGTFAFERVPNGDVQIVMLEQPFYPRMVFALGLAGGTRELGTKRVRTDDDPPSGDADDESADQWPDIRR